MAIKVRIRVKVRVEGCLYMAITMEVAATATGPGLDIWEVKLSKWGRRRAAPPNSG